MNERESKQLANHLDEIIRIVCINCKFDNDFDDRCKQKCGISDLRFHIAEFIVK
jgi:hypothetical protein